MNLPFLAGRSPPPPAGPARRPALRRDRVTALGYTSLAAYAYCLYALAPFLRAPGTARDELIAHARQPI
ncbi:hypothetical protein [Streptomyces sp. NPDC020742]|uniref:hypothetical protein n=1 Tax=Streptomyces sp. NPDC020742 TaxID=3154897 RepID=UPI003411542A